MTEPHPASDRNPLGYTSMMIATLALLAAAAHMSVGPFAPQEPVGNVVVDTALSIKDAAIRAATGAERAPPASAAASATPAPPASARRALPTSCFRFASVTSAANVGYSGATSAN